MLLRSPTYSRVSFAFTVLLEKSESFRACNECSERLNRKSKTANCAIPATTKNRDPNRKIPSAVMCLDEGLSAY